MEDVLVDPWKKCPQMMICRRSDLQMIYLEVWNRNYCRNSLLLLYSGNNTVTRFQPIFAAFVGRHPVIYIYIRSETRSHKVIYLCSFMVRRPAFPSEAHIISFGVSPILVLFREPSVSYPSKTSRLAILQVRWRISYEDAYSYYYCVTNIIRDTTLV